MMVKTRLNATKFRPLFGDWWPKIEPFFNEGGLDRVFVKLKARGKQVTITPSHDVVFRCFEETKLKDLKAVIVGMCPYHTQREDGELVADGLAFSCRNWEQPLKLQPSLEQLYIAWEKELHNGLFLEGMAQNDLSYLARQGVLLYNYALTTEVGTAGAHTDLWKEFSEYLFREVISHTGVPVVLLGKIPTRLVDLLAPWQSYYTLDHPAYASHTGIPWDSRGVFKLVSEEVKKNNGEEIHWIESLPF